MASQHNRIAVRKAQHMCALKWTPGRHRTRYALSGGLVEPEIEIANYYYRAAVVGSIVVRIYRALALSCSLALSQHTRHICHARITNLTHAHASRIHLHHTT